MQPGEYQAGLRSDSWKLDLIQAINEALEYADDRESFIENAANYLTARPTTQTFYINGQQAPLTAYLIGSSNYVRLRDVGKAVDFGVTYDADTNSVYVNSTQPYQEESAPATSTLSEETVRTAILELKKAYPHGAEYPTPYRPKTLHRPCTNCGHCAG